MEIDVEFLRQLPFTLVATIAGVGAVVLEYLSKNYALAGALAAATGLADGKESARIAGQLTRVSLFVALFAMFALAASMSTRQTRWQMVPLLILAVYAVFLFALV
jgi:hypothetical protein